MDQAAVWLAGSILFMLGFIVVITGLVIVNNIVHKYWKPIRVFTTDSWTLFGGSVERRFVTQDELDRIAPVLEEMKKENAERNNAPKK